DITARQRNVSRILTPSVQKEMTPAYTACQSQTGSGSFTRMKSHLEKYVQKHGDHIFCTACRKLMEQLCLLQVRGWAERSWREWGRGPRQ
ncbi:hypothetical protein scyTo_0024143, partial [Scyliorhinus torazame]|nr:hypothetical protein [Scyliorhinus torazame]